MLERSYNDIDAGYLEKNPGSQHRFLEQGSDVTHSPCTTRISLSMWETCVDQWWQELVGHLTRKFIFVGC